MGNTRTIKKISIAKTKNELLVDWFLNEIHWSNLAETLNYSKAWIFKLKKRVSDFKKDEGYDHALTNVFTVTELNKVIDLYNYYIENPELFKKPKTKKEVNLEEQEKAINKSMKEFQSGLAYERGSVKLEDKEDKKQVLDEHAKSVEKQRAEINKLPKGSPERAKKEAEFKHNRADRISEFWKNQNKDS